MMPAAAPESLEDRVASDPTQFSLAEKLWIKEVSKSVDAEKDKLRALRKHAAETQETVELLRTLPKKLKHDIMVPFGQVAMFPGQIIHTNETRVRLGADMAVETTAHHAIDMLSRRAEFIREQTADVSAQLQSLEARLKMQTEAVNEEGEEVCDIVEEYDEAVHGRLDGPAVPAAAEQQRRQYRPPATAEEAAEEEAWWQALKRNAAAAAAEEAAEKEGGSGQAGGAAERLSGAAPASGSAVPRQAAPAEGAQAAANARDASFDPFAGTPDSDDEEIGTAAAVPKPAQLPGLDGVGCSAVASASERRGRGTADIEVWGMEDAAVNLEAYESEVVRLAAAFDDLAPAETLDQREVLVPGPADEGSPAAVKPLVVPLDDGDGADASRLPSTGQPEPSGAADTASGRNDAAGSEPQGTSERGRCESEPAMRRGFFNKDKAPRKGILKKMAAPSFAPDPAPPPLQPRLSKQLLTRTEPTEGEQAAFSGQVRERSSAAPNAALAAASAAGGQGPESLGERPTPAKGTDAARHSAEAGTAREGGAGLASGNRLTPEAARDLAYLTSTDPNVEQLDATEFEDLERRKPVSKFRARLLRSRGEL